MHLSCSPHAGVILTGISAGYEHTCAVATGGGLWCWGNNNYGQLGISNYVQQYSPMALGLGAGRKE